MAILHHRLLALENATYQNSRCHARRATATWIFYEEGHCFEDLGHNGNTIYSLCKTSSVKLPAFKTISPDPLARKIKRRNFYPYVSACDWKQSQLKSWQPCSPGIGVWGSEHNPRKMLATIQKRKMNGLEKNYRWNGKETWVIFIRDLKRCNWKKKEGDN